MTSGPAVAVTVERVPSGTMLPSPLLWVLIFGSPIHLTCGIGEATRSFSKRGGVDGGMQTRSAFVLLRLKPPKVGWRFTMACGKLRREAFIGLVSRSSIWRSRRFVCNGEIHGYSGQRLPMNGTAM